MKIAARALPLVLAALAGAFGSTTAHAQDGDHVTVGAGVAAVPDFQGSKDYRVLPVPVLDVRMGQAFANVADGIGLHVVDTPAFKFGGSITFVRGYRRRDVPDGIDRLSDAAGARLFTSLRLGGVTASVGATRVIGGGTHGTIADARLSYPVQAGERLTIIPAVATTWANDKHMRRYFGVTSSEEAASGLPAYRPSGGFKDLSAGVTANYRLAGGLNLFGSANVTHLFDKAADSPIVESRWQPVGFVGVAYSF